MQFYQSEAAYVKFEFGVPRGSSLGLYARRNSLPTHTHYDVMHLLSGFKSQRTVRASPVTNLLTFPDKFFKYYTTLQGMDLGGIQFFSSRVTEDAAFK